MEQKNFLSENIEFSTFPEVLAFRARRQPDQTAYTFLRKKERIPITYEQLYQRVVRLAEFLVENHMSGKQAILLYSPGFEFIVGFFACLFAGAIAVPASPPATDRLLGRIVDIIKDADAAMILTDREVLGHLKKLKALDRLTAVPVGHPMGHPVGKIRLGKAGLRGKLNCGNIPLIATDDLNCHLSDTAGTGQTLLPESGPASIAFLQYTSGSTGSPKGVMVTHKNILHNSGLIRDATRITPSGVELNWLPMYHDMGIMTGIICPVHVGFLSHLMSTFDFIRDPLSWLRSISENRVTHSGGPNFAYALCVRRYDPEYLKGMDLSSWQVAFTGAEPICPKTMQQFTKTFAPYGFRAGSVMPCYGLAESTVGVCWAKFGQGPVYKDVDAQYLKHHIVAPPQTLSGARQLVSSGKTDSGLEIAIVDPQSREIETEDQIGEVWVAGDSIAAGYWNKPDITREVFTAKTANKGQEWLRTGDLGFISDNELYITGRIKDLIIIRGKNHYPQDIETSVQKIHPAIRQGACIAFPANISEKEALVVVLEVKSGNAADHDEIIKSVRKAVFADHELAPYAIVLLAPRAIPKTSSGKLQRKKCRSLFENNELEPIKLWIRKNPD